MPTPSDASSKGTVYCLLSAACYSGTNICLRQLAEIEADPAWVICLKETTAVLIIGPWLIWQLSRGVRPNCQHRALLRLFIASLTVQLIGNLSIQWALGIVGLAISLPIVFSTSLIGSAVIGSIVFHESLSTRSALAIILVIFSIVLLSLSATELNDTSAGTSSLFLTSLAIVAVSVSGIIYAYVGTAIRHAMNVGMSVLGIVFVVTSTGSLSLGILCLVRLGPAELLTTDPTVLAWIIAAGLFNVAAFSLITKGLQLTTLVHVNILNSSQVAIGALAGIFLFHEPFNIWLLSGIVLIIVGIGLFGQPQVQRPDTIVNDA